jgi:hypothetical protein
MSCFLGFRRLTSPPPCIAPFRLISRAFLPVGPKVIPFSGFKVEKIGMLKVNALTHHVETGVEYLFFRRLRRGPFPLLTSTSTPQSSHWKSHHF